MLDFVRVARKRIKKNGENFIYIYPKFLIKKSKDLMIKGGDFYAVWCEDLGIWSTDEDDVIRLVDKMLDDESKNINGQNKEIAYMWDSDSGSIDKWHKYVMKQMRDDYQKLNQTLVFANMEPKKENYSNVKLQYSLEPGDYSAYDELMSVLYSDEERHKIEWAIGSIVTGDSKNIQKFVVLYGSAGTGKSTVLNIIQKLFEGYWIAFDAKSIGNANSSFALEPFKDFPLVGIQHDGDLSRIEDNTRLNSLISHEMQPMNNKYQKMYSASINAFLFMGTNKPVKITDAKSGIIRRLIDVSPTGNKVNRKDYNRLMNQIKFELGAIAWHCKDVYLSDPGYYDNYIPTNMFSASNDFFNFILDSSSVFESSNGVTLKSAWDLYKKYCDDANIMYKGSKRAFAEELKNYFENWYDRKYLGDGTRVTNYYEGFLVNKFKSKTGSNNDDGEKIIEKPWLDLKEQTSILDLELSKCPAQYATKKETPRRKWEHVRTKLSDIDTHELHYVKMPLHHIVIDFDLKDENGNKSLKRNLEAANKWPKTYAEVSKGGEGLHLHYIYSADPLKLSTLYDDNIEIKVFKGDTSLRRRLSKCNNCQIATLSSGLPFRKEKPKMDKEFQLNQNNLMTLIKNNLKKEYHPSTKQSIDFIYKILEEAYDSGIDYYIPKDVQEAISTFASHSSNQAPYCVKMVSRMHFFSDNANDPENIPSERSTENKSKLNLVFYDVEVFPNLFIICYKEPGKDKQVQSMINPTPEQVEVFMDRYDLIGFNCRKYDNHILAARSAYYFSNMQLYQLSKNIIENKQGFIPFAYGISYTDIFDYAAKKQSLKKWEIELHEFHKELGMPWNEPVPESKWNLVVEYCKYDVLATEAVWNATQGDFAGREMLVALVKTVQGIDMSVNDTTNTLTQKLIFGNNRNPQNNFNYRDLSKPVSYKEYGDYRERFGPDYVFHVFNSEGLPEHKVYEPGTKLPDGYSILPFFPGYKFDQYAKGVKSTYLGEEIGEGGRVYSVPGMYGDVWDGDVNSMHPHSTIEECLFGREGTKIYKELVNARVAIKHKDFKTAGNMLNGALRPYLKEEYSSSLAYALKIAINSVYGLTSAKFANPFRDPRNIDNIVAKRGALFMTLLKKEVELQGYKVAHIKTDSIKIPNATPFIKNYVIQFGKEFGYDFETEWDFDKYCLINDAVYIGKDKASSKWVAVGKQFKEPYVFKKLFTHEPIEFEDKCQKFAVSKGDLYLDFNEELPDDTDLVKQKNKLKKDPIGNAKEIEALDEQISKCHNDVFVGRVGLFVPMKYGCNSGVLYRVNEGKHYAAPGSIGYRWMEADNVKSNKLESQIDNTYFIKMVDDAKDAISQYGDFEWFVSDEPYEAPLDIHSDKLPF